MRGGEGEREGGERRGGEGEEERREEERNTEKPRAEYSMKSQVKSMFTYAVKGEEREGVES